ncbi:isocitrate lyase/PEP mutase family protein [Lichenicoccus sp.]|uniref:isocitrate lyase/PEP mutase family protein n=1 Tax=Lichenicoccus sp. TaxID=2781899 RepID=UPI003D0A786B
MTRSLQLRDSLRGSTIVLAPGAYDGITARLIEQAGFPAVYMTGAGTSAARGYPDYGLLTLTEMVDNAAVLLRSVGVPVIADADTGYGNELNVTRTVREFEARGAAAIHIEDQVAPKRCGHLAGKEVTSREEFVSKIRAAVAAKRDPDFVLIARTDACAVLGLDEAIARANLALQAGADMAFVESPRTLDELAAVPKRVEGPCLLNVVPGGLTPAIDMRDAQDMGFRLAILPGICLREVIPSVDAALREFRVTGRPNAAPPGATVMDSFRRFGADEWDALRRHYDTGAASNR